MPAEVYVEKYETDALLYLWDTCGKYRETIIKAVPLFHQEESNPYLKT